MNSLPKIVIFITSIALIFATLSSANHFEPREGEEHSCYIKTSKSKIMEGKKVCYITYETKGCTEPSNIEPSVLNGNDARVTKTKVEVESAFVSFDVAVSVSGKMSILIHGVTSQSKVKRCVVVNFLRVFVHSNDTVTLHAQHLLLPNGVYNLTAIKQNHINSVRNSTSLQVIAHKAFNVGKTFGKRDVDLCPCSFDDCVGNFRHNYFQDSGLLQFYYEIFSEKCVNFTIKLLKKIDTAITSEEECLDLNNRQPHEVMSDLTSIGKKRYVDKVPVDFPNTPTGCYSIRTAKGLFHGFFWLETSNVTEMNTWNTTIVITPRTLDCSVEVTWLSPDYPFNFTSWQLTLWYVKDEKVHCEGALSENKIIKVFKPEEKVLFKTAYTFNNLSEGYYCVRIFPLDLRCPEDGCIPRSSKTVQLLGSPEYTKQKDKSKWLVMIVPAIVCVCIGIGLSFFFYNIFENSTQPRRASYTAVVPLQKFQLDPVFVLFIWTRASLGKNSDFESVISEFKNILRTYSNCKIIDYMDISSLDFRERRTLLENPTEWLHKHLQDSQKKIIFVSSPSVRQNGECPSNGVLAEEACMVPDSSLDNLLYPYVMRYLKESSDLSSDYGRIFYVRFQGLSETETEFRDLVPWMRFTIPIHFKELVLKLRGYSEESTSGLPDLPANQVNHLITLINRCKGNTKGITLED